MFKWQICCTEIINLLQFATEVQKSQLIAMHSATHIWKSCVAHRSCCLCFFMQAAASVMQLSSSSCVFTFLLLFIQSHNKSSMLQGRGRDKECAPDSNSSKLITTQNYTFLSQKLVLLPSKTLTFPPESPFIRYHCTKFSRHSDLAPGIGVFLIMTVREWKCKSTPSPEQQRQKHLSWRYIKTAGKSCKCSGATISVGPNDQKGMMCRIFEVQFFWDTRQLVLGVSKNCSAFIFRVKQPKKISILTKKLESSVTLL
jgi:hypothetical protein